MDNGCQIQTQNLGKNEIFQYKAFVMPSRTPSVTFVIYIEGSNYYKVEYSAGSSFVTIKKYDSEELPFNSPLPIGGMKRVCSLYDLTTGHLAKEVRLSDDPINQIDVSSLENNIYTLMIRENDEIVYQTKIYMIK